jgi:hypothetical protein
VCIQFLEEFNCGIPCFGGGCAAFVAALFDPLGFVGMVAYVVVVELWYSCVSVARGIWVHGEVGLGIPIHSSHFMLRRPIVIKYLLRTA